MIVEIAPAALCLAVFLAFGLAALGLRADAAHLRLAGRLTAAVFVLVSVALGVLFYAYIRSDFSVANVYENSHTAKPLVYKITGAWGNHEGSMLLWLWILTAFSCAYARLARCGGNQRLYVGTLAAMGFLSFGFLLFILLTSNPFARIDPVPLEGRDLNPLLQDIGLALHPPLLYLGYVGFSLVFGLTAGLLLAGGQVTPAWARQVRPWALLAWGFLTAGIGLGSWWAYRELGWGGWWFWDPVENISLLPWISGTALIHCLLILSKRPVLQNWTLLLAILTCALSLMGTFLVRSGLLTSVHSFASDPARGMYILCFTVLAIGGALALYAWRFPRPSPPDFLPFSREGGIMVNNLLLMTACATVFLGIIYPILLQAMALPSVSVGAPYYNRIILPLAMPLLVLAGIGPALAWKRAWPAPSMLKNNLRLSLAVMAALGLSLYTILPDAYRQALSDSAMALGGGLCGLWLLAATLAHARREWRAHHGRLPFASLGMVMAHGGLGIFALAATFASAGRQEAEALLHLHQPQQMAGYEIRMSALEKRQGQNYLSTRAHIEAVGLAGGQAGFHLSPEVRFYPTRRMETAEAAIDSRISGDVYAAISLLPRGDTSAEEAVVLRLYTVPAAFWLWAGFLFTAIGGMVAATGRFFELRRTEYAREPHDTH